MIRCRSPKSQVQPKGASLRSYINPPSWYPDGQPAHITLQSHITNPNPNPNPTQTQIDRNGSLVRLIYPTTHAVSKPVMVSLRYASLARGCVGSSGSTMMGDYVLG
jgi:hypothetical protein